MFYMGLTESYDMILRNTTLSQQGELTRLYESGNAKFDGTVLNIMYTQINKLRKIDFSIIDKSKGDVLKLSFFDDVEKGIQLVGSGSIVEQAWESIKARSKVFTNAYKISKDFVILTYQTLVMACLDGLSYLIQTASNLVDASVNQANKSIEVLVKYLDSVKKGTFDKAIKALMELKEDTLVSTESFITPTLVMGAALMSLLIVVPLIRELIFYFYYTRMRISTYLDQLHTSLQINEVEIKNSARTLPEKEKIIKKQHQWMELLKSISDKIRVSQVMGVKTAQDAMAKANKELNVDVIKQGMNDNSELSFG